ncbi:MAG TPA: hypothetical protein VL181_01260 [Holophagaceae bacterium]|nr:hypothetical protein [Holophagaceae bacterium]
MQGWTPPPFHPPSEARIQDGLDASSLFSPPRNRGRVPSATVEVVGQLDDGKRLQAFRDWLQKDLNLAFRVPPSKLQSMELSLFMGGNATDPAATLKALTLQTRGWYQAPLQLESDQTAAARKALGF